MIAILKALSAKPTMDGHELTKIIVKEFVASYSRSKAVTQSAFNLPALTHVQNVADELGTLLAKAYAENDFAVKGRSATPAVGLKVTSILTTSICTIFAATWRRIFRPRQAWRRKFRMPWRPACLPTVPLIPRWKRRTAFRSTILGARPLRSTEISISLKADGGTSSPHATTEPAMSPKVATPRKAPRRRKPPVVSADDQSTYEVILRTTDGATLKALVQDRVLYPMAVSWNRILAADRGRQSNAEEEQRSWQETGRESILKLAAAGDISAADTEAFITAAARSGRVQVEMEWRSEEIGYAARIFPWEALLALATKRERAQADNRRLVVVRWLKTTGHKAPLTGPAGFAVSAAAEKAGYDTATERAAIEHALRGKRELRTLPAKTLGSLRGNRKCQAAIFYHSLRPIVGERCASN